MKKFLAIWLMLMLLCVSFATALFPPDPEEPAPPLPGRPQPLEIRISPYLGLIPGDDVPQARINQVAERGVLSWRQTFQMLAILLVLSQLARLCTAVLYPPKREAWESFWASRAIQRAPPV